MYFYEFPPDVMAEITRKSGGMSVILLWLSGCVQLRHLISHRGGVTHIELIDTSPQSTSRWPMMLGELRGLLDLRLNRANAPLCCHQLVSCELSRMSQLRVLHLLCRDAESILKHDQPELNCPSFVFQLMKLEELSLSHLSAYLSEKYLPMNLQRLIIYNTGGPFKLDLVNQGQYRPNLHFLNLKLVPLPHYDLWSCLPLTTLKFEYVRRNTPIELPQTLTKLDIRTSEISFDVRFLPRSLTYLQITSPNASLIRLSLSLRHLNLLRTLKIFHTAFGKISPPSDFCFPLSLQRLILLCSYQTTRFIIPHTLTSLRIRMPLFSELAIETELPQSSNMDSSIGTQSLHLASSTSNTERNGTNGVFPNSTVPGLPPGLKSLTFDSVAKGALIRDLFESTSVPRSLEVLKVPFLSTSPQKWNFLAPSICNIVLEGINPFEQTVELEFTLLTRIYLHTDWIFSLPDMPQTLTSFVLISKGALEESFFNAFPAGIIELKLDERHNPRMMSLDGFETLSRFQLLKDLILCLNMSNVKDDMFKLLPRSIQKLELRGEGENLTGNLFQHLPRFLQCLRLKSKIIVNHEQVILLPRTLRTLELPNCNKLGLDCLSLLPTCLIQVQIGGFHPTYHSRWLLLTHNYEKSFPDHRIHENSFLFQCNATSSSSSPLAKSFSQNSLKRLQLAAILVWRSPLTRKATTMSLPIIFASLLYLWKFWQS